MANGNFELARERVLSTLFDMSEDNGSECHFLAKDIAKKMPDSWMERYEGVLLARNSSN